MPMMMQAQQLQNLDARDEGESSFARRTMFTYPMIQQSDIPGETRTEVMEICVNACEKHSNNNESAARMIKEALDKRQVKEREGEKSDIEFPVKVFFSCSYFRRLLRYIDWDPPGTWWWARDSASTSPMSSRTSCTCFLRATWPSAPGSAHDKTSSFRSESVSIQTNSRDNKTKLTTAGTFWSIRTGGLCSKKNIFKR